MSAIADVLGLLDSIAREAAQRGAYEAAQGLAMFGYGGKGGNARGRRRTRRVMRRHARWRFAASKAYCNASAIAGAS